MNERGDVVWPGLHQQHFLGRDHIAQNRSLEVRLPAQRAAGWRQLAPNAAAGFVAGGWFKVCLKRRRTRSVRPEARPAPVPPRLGPGRRYGGKGAAGMRGVPARSSSPEAWMACLFDRISGIHIGMSLVDKPGIARGVAFAEVAGSLAPASESCRVEGEALGRRGDVQIQRLLSCSPQNGD